MNACLPTCAGSEQPVDGASPPTVFTRWTKVVFVRVSPPVGPSLAPDTVSRSQATAPSLTKSGSVALVAVCSGVAKAQMVLVSKYCHAARIVPPTATTFGLVLGSHGLGAKKWVMICLPPSWDRVASGVKSV